MSVATWEDIDSFTERYPAFQLEDELLVEGGGDVMWGRHYARRERRGCRAVICWRRHQFLNSSV